MNKFSAVKKGIVFLAIGAATLVCARPAMAQEQQPMTYGACVDNLKSIYGQAESMLREVEKDEPSREKATLRNYMSSPESYPFDWLTKVKIVHFLREQLNGNEPERKCTNELDRANVVNRFTTVLKAASL